MVYNNNQYMNTHGIAQFIKTSITGCTTLIYDDALAIKPLGVVLLLKCTYETSISI